MMWPYYDKAVCDTIKVIILKFQIKLTFDNK